MGTIRQGVVGFDDDGTVDYFAFDEDGEPDMRLKTKPIAILKKNGTAFPTGFKEEWWSNGETEANAMLAYDADGVRYLELNLGDGDALIVIDAKRWRAR